MILASCMFNLTINIMITKRKELQIKRLQYQLNGTTLLSKKKQNSFERTNIMIPEKSLEKSSKKMRITRKYFTSDKPQKTQQKDVSKNDEAFQTHHKSLYNRPFHLLRQYLTRKQRLSYMPVLEPNPQKPQDFSQGYTTLNEFRIKKSKRLFLVAPENQLNEISTHNKINKIDQDFINFNASKNLYQMTQQQLEESIKWKKHFLDILNEKIRDSRAHTVRERSFK